MRLSRQTVSGLALPSGRSELIVFDEVLPGFGVRIRAGGKRVWIAQYRMGAKQRRVTIGSVQAIDPDEARRRAKEVLAHAQLGKDPQLDKAEARAKAAMTLGSVVERYLDRHAALRLKPKTRADTQRYLRHHWRPLHPLPLHKVERRHAAMRASALILPLRGCAAIRCLSTPPTLAAQLLVGSAGAAHRDRQP
jgi:Arm domain-containing DNA-binding protein